MLGNQGRAGGNGRRVSSGIAWLLTICVAAGFIGVATAVAFASTPHRSRHGSVIYPGGTVTVTDGTSTAPYGVYTTPPYTPPPYGAPPGPKLAPGLDSVRNSSRCPHADKALAFDRHKTSQASGDLLAPEKVRSILVCSYNGMSDRPPLSDPLAAPFSLVGHSHLLSAKKASKFAAELNEVKASGKDKSFSCPVDVDADLLVYLSYSKTHSYRYVIDKGGCNQIRSGSVARLANDAKVVRELTAAARAKPYGAIKGEIRLCDRTHHRKCHTENVRSCRSRHHCWSEDLVVIRTERGRLVAKLTARSGRFSAYLAPGRYRLVLAEKLHSRSRLTHIHVSVRVATDRTSQAVLQVSAPRRRR